MNILKKFIIIGLVVSSVLSWPMSVAAEDITVEATVDRKIVSVGAILQLTITIRGAAKTEPLALPPIDGFQSNYLGPSTQIRIINGQYSKTTAYNYILKPLGVGQFTIPAMDVIFEGKTYTTEPIEIEVLESQASIPAKPGSQDAEDLSNKIFLVLEVPRKQYYLGEQIPVVLKLYVQDLSVRDIEYPELASIGFSSEDYQKPKQYTQVIGGLEFRVVEFKTNLYPAREGDLTLGPAKLNASIIHRSKGRSGFGDFFEDEFFGSLFDKVERQPVAISSFDLPIKVLSLPSSGKPSDFSGAVGQFEMNVQISPDDLKVGDPITARITLSGSGDLNAITLPEFKEDRDFKVYEPQIKQENGTKVIEQVLIPKNTSVKEVPKISFNYFDSGDQKYRTLTQGPFSIKVERSKEDSSFGVMDLSNGKESMLSESIGRDLIYIKSDLGRTHAPGHYFYKGILFKLLFMLITAVFAGGYVFQLRRLEMESDVALARRLRAPKKAKKGLEAARTLAQKDKLQDCYDQLARTLKEYFGDKFHLPSAGLTYPELDRVLMSKMIDEDQRNKLKELFNKFDEARFAASSLTADKALENVHQSEEVIDYFERNVR